MATHCKIIFIVSALAVFSAALSRQTPDLIFQHLTTAEGLPSNNVQCVLQDHLGFMWFGTDGGLVRYDGYDMKIFKHEENDSSSISGDNIVSIHEDEGKNLWIATAHTGLSRFDRKTNQFTHFLHDPHDSTSLSSSNIWSCYLDRAGDLWIVTEDKLLDKISTKSEQITRYRLNPENPHSISGDTLSHIIVSTKRCPAIFEDSEGAMWFGTRGDGLNRYDRENDRFFHYKHDPVNPNSLSHNHVTYIYEDNQKDLWICTWGGGVNHFSRKTERFTRIQHDDNDETSLANNNCYSIAEDSSGKLWVSLQGGVDTSLPNSRAFSHYRYEPNVPWNLGKLAPVLLVHEESSGVLWFLGGTVISRYDPHQQRLTRYEYDPDNLQAFWGVQQASFYQDFSGIFWIATTPRGLNKLDPYIQNFTQYKNDPNDPHTISSNIVISLLYSNKQPNTLWIGTDDKGLDALDLSTGKFTHHKPNQKNKTSLADSSILALYQDVDNALWLGTNTQGLCKYDIESDRFTNYNFFSDDGTEDSANHVWAICQDADGYLWLGNTWHGGIIRFDKKDGSYKRYIHNPLDAYSLSKGQVWCLYQQNDSTLWIGTQNGLNKFNPVAETFKHYLENIDVFRFYLDKNGQFWIGTGNHGLCLFNLKTKNAVFYDQRHGLPNNKINSLMQDDDGYLWLGTDAGLVKFDPISKTFTNFYKEHGLPSVIFHSTEAKLPNGQIFMATSNGSMISFFPKDVTLNPIPPKIVFTDFKLFNKTLPIGGDSPLQQDITVTRELSLAHWQNDIAVECTALHYSHPEKNQYAFWLENYDDDWYNTGTNRVAVYTNLDPGEYILHARAANSDGAWNEEGESLVIKIKSPWWATIPAYFFLVLAFGGLVFVTWKLQLRRVHLRHELKMKDFEAAKLKEVDGLKSQFFANISHEFRTPLTLILGPLEKLYDKTTSRKLRTECAIMLRNGRRLLRLINQLLDFSKLEAGRMTLNKVTMDVAYLSRSIIGSFSSVADQKNIILTLQAEKEKMLIEADRDKVEKILVNLLSNALKFTPEGGTVKAVLRFVTMNQTDLLEIKICDNGIGIPSDKLPHIFDRFYQVDESQTRQQEGAGIGLALTKELVELHGGQIRVASEEGAGSTFTVILPVGSVDEQSVLFDKEWGEQGVLFADVEERQELSKAKKSKPLVLIIDDNQDVRCYIRDILSKSYKTSEAQDGLDGYAKATDMLPDLIISDVMMPGLDGFVLCQKLKTDERTSHIPVILLTAKAGEENKLSGLETGADAYVVKPFDARELRVRVYHLIEQRKKLRERFSKKITLEPSDITITSTDARFLQRSMDIIEQHLNDPKFDVIVLSKLVGMSRAQLYRKLRALVDLSPTGFILSIRLKRAFTLLEQHGGNVAEIAYKVGFNNPAYFADCFRKQFGKRPSEYKKVR